MNHSPENDGTPKTSYFTTFFATSARTLQCLWDIFVKRHSNDGIAQSFYPGFWHDITKTRVLSCFMPRGEQVVSASGKRKRRILRGFIQHRTENLIFLRGFRVDPFFCNEVSKTPFFTRVYATRFRKPRVLRKFDAPLIFP